MLIFYIISHKSPLSCTKDEHYQIRCSQVFPRMGSRKGTSFCCCQEDMESIALLYERVNAIFAEVNSTV